MDKEYLLYQTLANQYLLNKVPTYQVVSDLCGLQAQFASNPGYGLLVRASDYNADTWRDGIVKLWTFRGTLHAVHKDEVGLYLSARGQLPDRKWDDSWGIPQQEKPYWSAFIREQVESGIVKREDLKQKCLEKGIDEGLLERIFNGWGGLVREMCERGQIAYACETEKRFAPCGSIRYWDQQEARIEILRRYVTHFAPATLADFCAFTGFKKSEAVKLFNESSLPLRTFVFEGSEYYYLHEPPSGGNIPKCLFLAGFDQLLMGYKDRTRCMEAAIKSKVTTNTGIVFPTVLYKGKIFAKWKKEPKRIVITPFYKLTKEAARSITQKGRALWGELEVVFV